MRPQDPTLMPATSGGPHTPMPPTSIHRHSRMVATELLGLILIVTLPVDAFDSDSESQTETDLFDDHHRGYHIPFPWGDSLCIFCHADNTFACPICPNRRQRWRILNAVKDHILGMATSVPLKGENKKKLSRHCVMAWNEGGRSVLLYLLCY
uniref:Uncharacterized protein n=1 Tax=Setaria italica TaxID=4555 RepID=K3ZDQ0_SETIT